MGGEAAKLTHDIEARMKQLLERPPSVELPETDELLGSVSWLNGMDKTFMKKMGKLCQTKIYSNGQSVMKSGSTSQGMFIVVRGNVKIMDGKETIEMVGKGSVLGQKAILSEGSNKYGAVCETPVTALWLSKSNVLRLIEESAEFKQKLGELD